MLLHVSGGKRSVEIVCNRHRDASLGHDVAVAFRCPSSHHAPKPSSARTWESTKYGAHLMLQVQTRSLDGTLRGKFEQ